MNKVQQQVLLAAVVAGVLAGAGIRPADAHGTVKAEKHTAGPVDRNKCNNSCNGHCHAVAARR